MLLVGGVLWVTPMPRTRCHLKYHAESPSAVQLRTETTKFGILGYLSRTVPAVDPLHVIMSRGILNFRCSLWGRLND